MIKAPPTSKMMAIKAANKGCSSALKLKGLAGALLLIVTSVKQLCANRNGGGGREGRGAVYRTCGKALGLALGANCARGGGLLLAVASPLAAQRPRASRMTMRVMTSGRYWAQVLQGGVGALFMRFSVEQAWGEYKRRAHCVGPSWMAFKR